MADMLGPYTIGPNQLSYGVYTGDCRELGAEVPDSSVDIIFTDPPYPHEYLSLYGWLSTFAERVLKPGGFCLAYAGKTALPTVIEYMGSSLEYYWIFDVYEPGASVSLWKWKLWGNHRPILAYTKGEAEERSRWIHDAIRGRGRDKRYHAWGQSQGDAEYYLWGMAPENGIVVDPFCGGGTTPAACASLGLRWLAFEIEADEVAKARERIANTQTRLPMKVESHGQQLEMAWQKEDTDS